MDFISWLVVGALFMLAEFGIGSFYLLALGLACAYPAYASYSGASTVTQIAALSLGFAAHALVVRFIRKRKPATPAAETPDDAGQRVEVLEWFDEGSARVMYHGKEWLADKAEAEMPDADHGIIKSVQYGRLVITTEQPPSDSAAPDNPTKN